MTERVPQRAVVEGPERAPASARPAWRSLTAWVLIAANLVPLYGVLVLGWAVLPILVLFWLENVVIGVLNVLRMAVASPGAVAAWPRKLPLILFFCVHYGLFTAIHGLFVFALFGGEPYQALVDGLWTVDAARHAINEFALWPALAALAASHLFSFFWNYLGYGEFRVARPELLMRAPYGRVIVLQVTIIFGGMLAQALHSPLWALLLLIAFKIALDLRAHIREHRTGKVTGPASDSGQA
jgi:Family of unknown function (DUF6498)